ncbi:DUF4249 domain-containing protein [Marinilabilia salmonicolor]|jgi:hypothetical protein|uniref:Uncharacterized protein DUF4249 n=1 Tax=Marinilabilia salmonicolor TaxID=989 RepID=A0A368UV68_9BACT|nr:DUF4249 domain-containing protein [Marinilabilia salmonicolor]RCW32696.1 uncharacterized protein DUF4249 [Marinilabilia salmonicolor]
MKQLVFIINIVMAVFLSWGCAEYIDLDLETSDQKLVVDGMITSERHIQYVRLSRSVAFMDDTVSPPVSGARVLLSDGYNVETLREANEMAGFYVAKNGFAATPGNSYELTVSEVDIDGDGVEESYQAISYMPHVNKPDSIDLLFDASWEMWKVLLWFNDPPDSEDYYLFRVLLNGTLISERISEFTVVSDRFFENGRADGVWVQSINANEEAEPLQEGDVVTLQMCGITEEYFDFVKSVQRESRGQYPLFSGPPANVPGNISNGALGFFTAFSVSYANLVVSAGLLEEKNNSD